MENNNNTAEENKQLYTLRVPSGSEDSVIEQLRKKYKDEGVELGPDDIYSPSITKKVGKKERKHTLCKGYIFIKTHLNERITNIITSIPRVSFLNSSPGKPGKICEREYQAMKSSILQIFQSDIAGKTFAKGDIVKIKSGSFNDFQGTICDVKTELKRADINVVVFGRTSSVTVNFEDIEKVDAEKVL